MTSLNSGPGKGYRYYWCRGPDVHRTGMMVARCPRPTVLAPELDSFVWSDVVRLLTDPELLGQALLEQRGKPMSRSRPRLSSSSASSSTVGWSTSNASDNGSWSPTNRTQSKSTS